MTAPHAHLSWTATALGAGFGATWVQRLDALGGWFDIGRSVVEAHNTFDDFEPRYGVQESYRTVVETNLGVRSVAAAAVNVTIPVPTNADVFPWSIASNEDPTVNQQIPVTAGIDVALPERVSVDAMSGRDYARIHRGAELLGEHWDVDLELLNLYLAAAGPALWRTFVAQTRKDLSYLCLLDRWGNRTYVGFVIAKAKATLITQAATVNGKIVQVGDTPSVASF